MTLGNIARVCVAAVVCAGFGAEAKDAPAEIWKKVGFWDVKVMSGECSATTSWPGGTDIRLGYMVGSRMTELVLSNPSWKPTGQQSSYDLVVQFGKQMPWRVPGNEAALVDLRIKGEIGFFENMMKEDRMVVRYAGKYVDEMELRDAQAAIYALKDCQKTWFGL